MDPYTFEPTGPAIPKEEYVPNKINFRDQAIKAYPNLINYYYTEEEQKKLKLGKYSNANQGHLCSRRK